jgi:hydrogenase nickel incorporation protein HypB
MFAASSLMILNKTDLLPYLQFDVDRCIEYARRVNPQIKVLQLSATSGQGMKEWLDWIQAAHHALNLSENASHHHQQHPLTDRIAALESELAALKEQVGQV